MRVRQTSKVGGFGKTILRNSVRLYSRLGVRKVFTTADLDAGGYAWARFGFRPSNTDWRALKPQLESRLTRLRHQASPEAQRVVRAAVDDPDGAAIWLISDLAEPVGADKLGRHLLAGTTWEGYLDLKDPDAMDRFIAYVGGQDFEAATCQ